MDAGRHGSRSPCGLFSLPLWARRPRSSEDATPPLLSGLIGLGRVASFLPCVPLLLGGPEPIDPFEFGKESVDQSTMDSAAMRNYNKRKHRLEHMEEDSKYFCRTVEDHDQRRLLKQQG
ncbi:hypothetical protein NDU88_005274 [Pleurodeles waltl]|uniref:Uncharacterized protein n=1 Tax=Pleurodeles waltl TaxID=8319 RepID=A0AAV7LP33_PLEWA|nr:hypothetical protein NDU88_005274 [Pleurodeles waltl]